MSIIAVANIFNLLAQQSRENGGLQHYKCGEAPDVNTSRENNTNPFNLERSKMPMLLFLLPEGRFPPSALNKNTYAITLYFYDFMHHDDDGTSSPRDYTDVLKLSNLGDLAKDFLRNFWELGGNGLKVGGKNHRWSIEGEVQFRTAFNAHTDNLMAFECGFNLVFGVDCPEWTFDPLLISPDYNIDNLFTTDFETVIPSYFIATGAARDSISFLNAPQMVHETDSITLDSIEIAQDAEAFLRVLIKAQIADLNVLTMDFTGDTGTAAPSTPLVVLNGDTANFEATLNTDSLGDFEVQITFTTATNTVTFVQPYTVVA